MKRDFDQVKFIKHNGVELPSKSTDLAGAFDLTARGIIAWYDSFNKSLTEDELVQVNDAFKSGKKIALIKGDRICFDTDLQVADVPVDFRGDIKSRSGLALKNGVFVLNADGLIDADYRNNLGVILTNISEEPFVVAMDDRIAQIEPRIGYEFEVVSTDTITVPDSNRAGGFGSTGVSKEDK